MIFCYDTDNFVLSNEKKQSKKNGKIPLYMRFCFNGQKAEARLAVEITEFQKNELWGRIQ